MIDLVSFVVVKLFVDVVGLKDETACWVSISCILRIMVYKSWSVGEVAVDNRASAGLDKTVG
jgi:hypothetical protein